MRLPHCLALVGAFLTACATAPTSATSATSDESPLARVQSAQSDDPNGWRELRSPHFIFVTNLGTAHARERLARLEYLRATLLTAVWPNAKFPETPVRLVCFSSRQAAIDQLRPPHTADFTFDFEGGLPVVSWQYETDGQPLVMHQLFHALAAKAGIPQPVWMQEGVAQYFATIRIDDEAHTAEIGNAFFDPRLHSQAEDARMPLGKMLKVTRADFGAWFGDNREFYNAADTLVAYLINEQPAAWMELQKRLAAGDDGERALWASMKDMTPDKLESELARFQNGGVYHLKKVAIAPPPAAADFPERVFDPVEIALLRAELSGLEVGVPPAERLEAARGHLQSALQRSPEEPRLLEALAELDARSGHCPDAQAEDARASAHGALPAGAAEKHATVLAACPAAAK